MSGVRTGRGDTVYGVSLAVISVGLVLFGTVVLFIDRHQMGTVRARLDRNLAAAASRDHASPRDPLVLRQVRGAMPRGVRLEPSQDFAQTGRLLIVWRPREGGLRTDCVVVPTDVSGRVTACRRPDRPRPSARGSASP
jgi:hypothetical protein